MARADSIVQTAIDNGRLTITVQGHPTITVDPADYPQDLLDYAALHGFKQKYADAAALGAEATVAEKYAAIRALVNHHRDTGEWNRTTAGDGSAGDGLLVKAIMEFNGMNRDAARTAVSGLDKPTQSTLRRSSELKPIIDRIKLERPARTPKSAASVDVAAILSGLTKG